MDIRATLTQLGVPFWEAGQHKNVRTGFVGITCPTCTPTGKSGDAKLGINLISLYCRCWTCGPARLGTALAELTGRRVGEILSLLPGRLDPRNAPADRETGRYTPPAAVGPLLPAHRRYLEGRGIDPDYAADVWGIGGIGHDGGAFAWRLFMPVPYRGKPASWTTRAVGDHPRRYWAADAHQESRPLKSLLYGEHLCTHGIVVVEGPVDAIVGGPGFAATFGTAFTTAQVSRIAKHPVRCIAFDNEPAAQRAARRLADQLAVYPGTTAVAKLSGPDPATSPITEIRELRELFLT